MTNDTGTSIALECRQVTMKVRKKEILNEVTFSLEKGRIAGLLGPNGAGKSTLLSICSGLTEPTSGSVRIFGQPAGIGTLRSIAVLPDRGKLPGWLTAGEWLAFADQIYPDWDFERSSSWFSHYESTWERAYPPNPAGRRLDCSLLAVWLAPRLLSCWMNRSPVWI